MNGRFTMNFTHINKKNSENIYRRGEAQYHNYGNLKRYIQLDKSISQPSENILINEGISGISSNINTYTKPIINDNNYVKTQRNIQTIPPQQQGIKKAGYPGSMYRFLMSLPTGSGCSVCGGK